MASGPKIRKRKVKLLRTVKEGAESSGDDDGGDTTYSATRLIDGKPERFPASKLTYADLKGMNIFYDNEEVSIESIKADLKKSISSQVYSTSPEVNKVIETYSRITSENLTFSIDLENIRQFHRMNWNPVINIKEIVKDLKKNSENVGEGGYVWVSFDKPNF